MNILGIIPARYASTRFPGKPLVIINGTSMIMRVYEQAKKCADLQKIIVATDDQRICAHVINHGGEAVITSETHHSGTERCREVLKKIPESNDWQAVINIQGDEPFINPEQIGQIAALLRSSTHIGIATLIKKISDPEEPFDPNTVKVVTDASGRALYFSRSAIPYLREQSEGENTRYKHIGIYGYRSEVLNEIANLPVAPPEKSEKLEQLRWLYHGYTVYTAITEFDSKGIDTPNDLSKLINIG
ncbi:MAG: 3-deoxy-manno-octulosonate cytidylyltransferase [Bacteroidales bacterium]|nr:3-deoxy-manno-octulosonate cytidylyltransferase [Bacteroidales bacterium]MDD2322606.1 3-deoxy-manno-octulosonate cytidylyltransferase [Bacteroidales bacterium]MDD3010021.1 3-deoxy-manno-octulosonate cytidylyltransferase [Bacteroidales bacterium]MDD3960952.1 3-deoxy-manno-octulosonate cytidylyltransferase [Bacteroidales bacterium]MDY0285727.1 3-deoxy-manno-octulosonate cytidylyltransferase [Bacteroidales bacterium]